MVKKIGQKITHNFGLKLLAILFAIVLWIVVVNIDDPTQTLSYTTSVNLENTSYLTSMDKYYEVLEGTNTVTFRVTAKRSVHDKLNGSDFSAAANMGKIEYDEKTETYRVPVTITAPQKYSKEIEMANKQNYIELSLEDLSRTQKIIKATTKGSVADGYALGDVKITSYNVLKISGPASIVSQIDTVTAVIDVDNVDTDVTDSVAPILLDADGNVVDTTKLTLSLSTVTISAQILSTKDVPVQFSISGTLEDGYMVTGISYQPTEVRIKGESAILNTISAISVPKEVLNLDDRTTDLETDVDITAYLPEGTALVLNSDGKITVTVKVEPIVEKTYQVPIENITAENLSEEYECEYDAKYIKLTVSGSEEDMDILKRQNITGTLDLTGLTEGEHTLTPNWNLDGTKYKVDKTEVIVMLVKKEQTEDTQTEDTQTEDTQTQGTEATEAEVTEETENTAESNTSTETETVEQE